jgi:hypothetical protein
MTFRENKERDYEKRISLISPPHEGFPAGKPFYIMHGWLPVFGETKAIGVFDFNLEINGEQVEDGLIYIQPYPGGDYGYFWRIYNFPQGMPEGTYTFVGRWYAPCQSQIVHNPSLDCPQPNEPLLSETSTVTITFTP